jgi:hypothetical protein
MELSKSFNLIFPEMAHLILFILAQLTFVQEETKVPTNIPVLFT